ncbi:MAG: hypothetical protein JJU33_14675 [Phycisphaerales bacterium]|nr:hypothetical protein [Phycisphaerales bacterium]
MSQNREDEKPKPTKKQSEATADKRDAMAGPDDHEHADIARDRSPKPEDAEKFRKASQTSADEEEDE